MEEQGYWAVRRHGRRTVLRSGAIGAAGLTAFALACGSSDKKESTGSSGSSGGSSAVVPGATTAATQAAQQETPKPGGIVSTRLQTDPPSLDIHQVTTYTGVWPVAPAFNQLVQFDPQKPGNAPSEIVSDLAEKWEQPDPTTLVFTLRKGVKFHDGSDFTSEDVKVQLDWIKKPPQGKVSPRAARFATIDSIETPDPYTARLKLTRPTPSLLPILATHYFAIGNKADITANGEIGPKMIGTGPFKLKSYQRSNVLELEKNPAYHIQGRPYLDGLKFFILPDYATALTNFQGGQLQTLYDSLLKPSDQDRLKSEMGDKVDALRVQSPLRDLVFMNARKAPYNDQRVRQAISLVIDRDAAIKVVKEGAAKRGGYMTPGASWAIAETELRKYDGYDKPDIEKAKGLMQQAGVTSPITASATTRTDFKELGELLKDQLAKIGIALNLTLADTATAQPVLQRGDFDISPWIIGIDIDDPDATFAEISTSSAVRNWSAVKDPEIDALFDKQSQTLDTAERKKIVQDLERKALSVYQIANLFHEEVCFVVNRSVRNFVVHSSLYTNRRFENVWLKA